MLKVIFSLILLFGVACLAKEIPECPTCASVLCKYPSICVEEEVTCIRAPCCKVPVCIPVCGDDVCEPDEECVVDPCFVAPCPAHCEKRGGGCDTQEQEEGETGLEKRQEDGAEEAEDNKVEEKEEEGEDKKGGHGGQCGCPDDPCAGVRCESPLTCTPEIVVCVRAPCCPVPKCSCDGVDCEGGKTCQELFCIDPPCGRRCL